MNPRCKAGLLLLLAPLATRAEQWTLDNKLSTRYEVNDNAPLAINPRGSMNALSVSTSLQASRRSENASTGVRAAMTAVEEQGPGSNDRLDGQWGLTQTFDDPLHSLDLSASYLQDINNQIENSDVLVGRSRRRSSLVSARLSRQFSPRIGGHVQGSFDRTRYGASGGSDYRNGSLGGGLSYRSTELQTWSLNLSHGRYRTEAGTYRSTTDQLSLGWSQAMTERYSLSLSIGGYRSRNDGQRFVRVCGLAPSWCVDNPSFYVLVAEAVRETKRGLQFNLSGRLQLDETTDFSLNAAREQSPSGVGVVARRDTLSAQLGHSFSPVMSGSVGYARNRALYGSFGGDITRSEESLSLSISRRLSDDLSLQAGATHRRAHGSQLAGRARSSSVAVSLSLDWPRLEASR
ncbi:hypothetical protein [Piscinibacter sp. HJYY11]|uniref:hypothetical protein n=1 Tax=Piscinibacter sp. HJYY11 TaxID=2801333 RepID=UPI00191CACF9|nr:hypothetical protein [Piscinibacter sp. HJYY11]MBL0726194.1 hypothetical protein [Piscinibacter sp. HJYY11]